MEGLNANSLRQDEINNQVYRREEVDQLHLGLIWLAILITTFGIFILLILLYFRKRRRRRVAREMEATRINAREDEELNIKHRRIQVEREILSIVSFI